MNCPKCQATMRTVDRQGIHVEQCESCRGIFLDRGELEQIIGAEKRHYAAEPIPPYEPERSAQPAQPAREPWGNRDSPRGYRGSPSGYGDHGKKRRKRSFLEELFD